ncbi:MAG: glycoside hydrolase family 9 protein [Pyrinomonadaceae bacterium]
MDSPLSSETNFKQRATAAFLLLLILLVNANLPTQSAPGDKRNEQAMASNEQAYLRINQLGFAPRDVKTAVALSRAPLPEAFRVMNAATNEVVFAGQTVSIPGGWGQFDHHAELNFSALQKEGTYSIQLGASRTQFKISSQLYAEVPDQLLEFMRQQRCGYNPFVDAACHTFDGRTAYGPQPAGTYLNATGGWHDAGDQLKYLLTGSNATAQMLLAYQLANRDQSGNLYRKERKRRAKGRKEGNGNTRDKTDPKIFADRFNDLGQPGGNNIPDILDEARWGLEWMLRLHPAPEQLYHQVADDRDHKGFRLPQKETVDYGWGAGSYRVVYFADGRPQGLKQYQSESNGLANLAGRYAAAMALGYQIWNDRRLSKSNSDLRGFAEKLLRAAEEVYALGQAKEGVQQGNSYGAPYRYAETTWADDMEWGAAELLRATGNKRYLRDARRYAAMAAAESWMGRAEAGHYQYYPFMNLGHFRLYDLVDTPFKKRLAGYYREGIEHCFRAGESNPYNAGVPFIWCSNNLVVALATQCDAYQRMTGDARYSAFAAKQRDWLLGRNPWGVSMFTEIPHEGVYPKDVHLFGIAILKRMVRGGLVDGPVYRRVFQTLRGVTIREPDPFAAFQDERAVYHDDISDYSTNEPTMDGTASAILLWAMQGPQVQ